MKMNVYVDEHENKLEFYLNKDNYLYLQVGNDELPCGWIVLLKDDLLNIINDLKSLYEKCNANDQL